MNSMVIQYSLYNIHTTNTTLQTEEIKLGQILDTDYSKVDINDMVDNLDIKKVTRPKQIHLKSVGYQAITLWIYHVNQMRKKHAGNRLELTPN